MELNSGLKTWIVKDNFSARSGFYIYYRQNGKIYAAKPTKLEFVELDEYGSTEGPTIAFSQTGGREFFESMRKELDEMGVKAPSEETIAGRLEAMRDHLRDLRILLKLEKPEVKNKGEEKK